VLLPIGFLLTFMLTLTGALLANGLRAAKIAQHADVARYSAVTIADGVADFTHGLAQFVALHGSGGPWPLKPSHSALRSACSADAACPFEYAVSGVITAASAASTSGADAAPNLQAAAIDEQRVSAIVTVSIIGRAGVTVGTRTRFLTYRVFTTAPYAVISGSRDVAAPGGAPSSGAQGDTGGTAGDPAPIDPAATPPPGDTRIHVRLTCGTVSPNVVPFANDQQAAGNDGLPWGDTAQAAHESPCVGADAWADDFRDEHWGNGDANASGWTR